jgi:hypothetical protein
MVNHKRNRRRGKFGYVIAQQQKLSAEEFREDLISAGVIDHEGKLTEKYKKGVKK